MNLKRSLIENLPSWTKRLLAIPYDRYQVRTANAQFARKNLEQAVPRDDAPHHTLCVVVDALRSDHIDEQITPYLDSLNGTDAITPGAWTFPAVSSMLSGVYPHEHGALKQVDEPDDSGGITLPPKMDDDRETITEVLAGAGYDTYGGFGHDTPFVALSGRFEEHALYHKVNSNADDVLEDYLEWVEGRDRTFAFVHLADPHVPVDPPREYWEAHDVDPSIENIRNFQFQDEIDCDDECQRYREHRRRLYRAAIDYVDDALSTFTTRLDDTVQEPLVLVTADHGEALWEHVAFDVERFNGSGCVGHGGTPYEPLARVPLMTNADWSFDGHVSLVDLAPTLADAVGIDVPETSGYSLLDQVPAERMPIVEGSLNGYEKKAIYKDEYKLIVSHGDDVEVGFTMPDEEVVEIPEETRETMLRALPSWPDGSDATTEVSGVVEDRLANLGYR